MFHSIGLVCLKMYYCKIDPVVQILRLSLLPLETWPSTEVLQLCQFCRIGLLYANTTTNTISAKLQIFPQEHENGEAGIQKYAALKVLS